MSKTIKVKLPRNTARAELARTGTGASKVMRDRRARRSKDARRHFNREEWS